NDRVSVGGRAASRIATSENAMPETSAKTWPASAKSASEFAANPAMSSTTRTTTPIPIAAVRLPACRPAAEWEWATDRRVRLGSGRHLQPALAERPRRELRARSQVEPLEEPAEVRLHGLRADPESRPDLVIRATVDDEPYDVELALAEPGEATATARSNGEGESA